MAVANPIVGLITTQLKRGGAERQLCHLAKDLRAHGVSVCVLSLMTPEVHVDDLRENGVSVDTLELQQGISKISYRKWKEYCRWVNRSEIDLGVFFNFHPILLGRLSWKLGVLKCVISAIRCERFGNGFRDRLIAWTNQWCSLNSCNSKTVAEKLAKRGILGGEGTGIVRNGLDLEWLGSGKKSRIEVRRRLGLSEREFTWLAAGRLEPVKDFVGLVEAFSEVRQGNSRTVLLIAGDGSEKQNIEKKIADLGLQANCRLVGARSDMPNLYGAVDGLVVSSVAESFPNVVMEAIACGLPVVSTNVGGVNEILSGNGAGIVVVPGDPTKLAEGMMASMSSDRKSQLRHLKLARELVQKVYSREAAFKQWLELFAKVGIHFS